MEPVRKVKDPEQVKAGGAANPPKRITANRARARLAVRAEAWEMAAAETWENSNMMPEVEDMPYFDGTGPMGAGPMTGGRRGLCNAPWQVNRVPFRGFDRSFAGFGRRFRGTGREQFSQAVRPNFQENVEESGSGIESLKEEVKSAKAILDSISQRLSRLENVG
jgi:hypothetical protein